MIMRIRKALIRWLAWPALSIGFVVGFVVGILRKHKSVLAIVCLIVNIVMLLMGETLFSVVTITLCLMELIRLHVMRILRDYLRLLHNSIHLGMIAYEDQEARIIAIEERLRELGVL